jgi:small subunit ribosomal protein S1
LKPSEAPKAVAFKVLQIINEEGKRPCAILSRKEAQRECLNSYILDLIPGDIIPARVTHFEPFGAFVDIGCGIVSLMSVDSISVSRIPGPQERFKLREQIKVVVKNIDYETGRIYTSTRELLGSWEENASKFSVGQTVSGIVRSVEDYGIFVELAPNLAGLAELKDGVKAGQSCAVYIKSIVPEKMKIKLVIIDTYDTIAQRKPLDYFVDTNEVTHIDYWKYSPASCDRIVETRFE